jgi:hypothetical protein
MLASMVDDAKDQFIKTMKEAERAWMKSTVNKNKYNIASKRRENALLAETDVTD